MRDRHASPREAQVLELKKKGMSNRDIAEALKISSGTVKIHTGHLISKGLYLRRTSPGKMYIDGRQVARILLRQFSQQEDSFCKAAICPIISEVRQLFADKLAELSDMEWAREVSCE